VITQRQYFGHAHAQALPALPTVLKLASRFARLRAISAGAPGGYVQLENPTEAYRRLQPGAPHHLVWNIGLVNSFDVQDHLGNVLVTVAPGEAYEINLASTASRAWAHTPANSIWDVHKRLVLS
jgi:hypothetical protein